ncbi:MAG: DUF4870 domain-containing protein [Candidatus Acidiferrales bacterium]
MADTTLPAPTIELTQDEKAYAGLAHALMIGTWWIGPLVIYLSKKESRFVAFHALQALFWQIIFTVLYFGAIMTWVVAIISTVALHPQTSPANQQFPVAVFIMFPIFWLFIMGGFALTLTLGIMFCLKAMRGEWAGYPVIGRWARKIVGF